MKNINIKFTCDLDWLAFMAVVGFIAYKVIENRDTFKYHLADLIHEEKKEGTEQSDK